MPIFLMLRQMDGWMYYYDNDNMYVLIHLVAR
jgi:hypothetical protein